MSKLLNYVLLLTTAYKLLTNTYFSKPGDDASNPRDSFTL
jgi:hypothetical protein